MAMPNLCLMYIQMHFDDGYGAYFDFGNHTEKVFLFSISMQTFARLTMLESPLQV